MTGAALRLGYVCGDPGIPADGTKGASVHFRELARALRDAGVELDPVVARGGEGTGSALPGARIVRPARGTGIARELSVLANSAAIAAALSETGPHDAVFERLSLFSAGGLAHARDAGIPLVVEVNAPLWEEAARFRTLHLSDTARALALEVLQGADLVIAVSATLAADLIGEGVDAESILVLGNGVRLDAFDSCSPEPRPAALEGRPLLVFSGSLKPWHGLEFLCEAFAACRADRPLALRIVGDGPLRERIEQTLRPHAGDVIFDGAVPHERIPAILGSADAVVAPYTADAPSYFSPLKVVEGVAARRPILASRVPSVVEAAGSAPGVFLFEPGDLADFRRALDELLATSWDDGGPPDSEHRRGLAWSRKVGSILAQLAEVSRS